MNETVFDRILAGEIPCDTVYEDEHVLAFNDIDPQAPVHVLVIPKKRVRQFADLAEWGVEPCGNFFSAVSRVAAKLKLDPAGYRIVINSGDNGGQTVAYLHAHILGGRRMQWPPG